MKNELDRIGHLMTSGTGHPHVKVIQTLCAEILGRDSVSSTDNFFALGGTSMQLYALMARIKESIGMSLDPVETFIDPTVYGIAMQLQNRET